MTSLRTIEKNYETVSLETEKEKLVGKYNRMGVRVDFCLRFACCI